MPEQILIEVTPGGVLAAFVALLVLVSAAFLAGVWAMRPDRPVSPGPVADVPECAVTEEWPPRPSGPRSHTAHAPQYRRPADDTTAVVRAVRR